MPRRLIDLPAINWSFGVSFGDNAVIDSNSNGTQLGGAGARVNSILTDNTMAGASNTNLYTGQAVKQYVDNKNTSGQWVPTPRFETPGTSTWSMTRVGGYWWRVGNMVTVIGYYRGAVSVGDAAGMFFMGGLPYSKAYTPTNPNWSGNGVNSIEFYDTDMPIDFGDFPQVLVFTSWTTDLAFKLQKTGLSRDIVASDFSDGNIDFSFGLTYRT